MTSSDLDRLHWDGITLVADAELRYMLGRSRAHVLMRRGPILSEWAICGARPACNDPTNWLGDNSEFETKRLLDLPICRRCTHNAEIWGVQITALVERLRVLSERGDT